MQRLLILAILGAAVLGGCAQTPESVQASYISPVTYDDWTCKQLSGESVRVDAALATASKQQSDARTGDTVGILLLGLPAASMSGKAVAPEIARLKGSKEAIQQSMTLKNC